MYNNRVNMLKINDIAEFGMVRGRRTGDTKDVYLVKFVGADSRTFDKIEALLTCLIKQSASGEIVYKHIKSLSEIRDFAEYPRLYDEWIRSQMIHMDTAVVREGVFSEAELSSAVKKLIELLKLYKKNISSSITRNIVIKLLYWLDENFRNVSLNTCRSIKIVCENVLKESEVYFFVLLSLLGMDVCMLQYSGDCKAMEECFHTKILGSFVSKPDFALKPDDTGLNHGKLSEAKEGERRSAAGNKVVISLASTRKKEKNIAFGKPSDIASRAMRTNTGHADAIQTDVSGVHRELSYVELARLSASIVMISVYDSKGEGIGTGSGIMIGSGGFILTNCHVISGGHLFEIRIEEDESLYTTTEIIKYNQHLDLAVLRISKPLTPLRVYDGRDRLVRGQRVVAIGSPLGLFNSVSDGIISGFRNIEDVDMIQFSAPTSPGSSGGAVLNMFGEVIGISTAGFSRGQNINLAVPYDAIRGFAQGFMK